MSTHSATPQRKNIRTSADLIGQLINIYRLPGEGLAAFKERVLDSYIHGANSTYEGLYNGINRELGLDGHTKGILIDVERDSDGHPTNALAGLEVSTRYLTLYSSHLAGTVLSQIDLRERGVSYFVSDLSAQIDSIAGWESVLVGLDDFDKSYSLLQQSSLKTIRGYTLKTSRVQNLNDVLLNGYFLTGDILFSLGSGVRNEVTVMPAESDEFLVDYDENILHLGQVTTGTVTFQYQKLPLLVKWSPVTINSFKDNEFMDLITEQILDEDQLTVDGIPTSKGAEYINELLSAAPQYWGE
ncbi:MAG: hypothetical protein ACXABY_00240 [Candidatus Thorarchaeota archaeon]|jgi:hypothetical protein